MSSLYVIHTDYGRIWHWFTLSGAGQFLPKSIKQFRSYAEAQNELQLLLNG